ncbi:hypothetical protein DN752_11230 [Echinicola strongylocentroti]|uniref:Uncharacterized protein n=1 Tax=Echinicola strongylocentroti TaxID=1795355 RepID=A0A2Z4IHP3_9BACT|nr:hypothetical protein [Echinicola strongylocentroti]AWW30651.1 hypothetical protein DN752_11230 [Echinicola strongylocentroti]
MKITSIALLVISVVIFYSCSSDSKKEKVNDDTTSIEVAKPSQKTTAFRYEKQHNSYPDAILELHHPLENQVFDEGDVAFEFNIKNYPFEHGHKGFQLKMIINGNDPIGYNSPIFKENFDTGTYKVLAFLVDDEGMALKEYGNYVERDFVVGKSKPFPESDDPYIGLNKPENGQVYEAGEEVLVDFVLVGGDLQEDSLQIMVKAGEEEFTTHELGMVNIANLPTGTHQVSVALVDANGKELPGIFSKTIREIEVK